MRELPDDYSRRVRDQLYHARPDGAQFYALASVGGGANSGRRYPMSGSYLLCPENQFELPYGAPEGEYRVLFYRQQLDNTALPYRRTHPSFRLFIQWPGQGPISAAHPESGTINPATKSVERDPALREAEIEFEKHKMAVAMQRDTHQLVRSAAHARDVGESYAVVSAYRQDSYLSAEAHGALNRRMIESTSKIQEIHVGLVQSIEPTILAVKRAAELLTVPPPPVDYTPVLAKTVEVVGTLLNQLIDRDSRHRAADDELRDGGKTRAMKQAQTECEPSRKSDDSQSEPPNPVADKCRTSVDVAGANAQEEGRGTAIVEPTQATQAVPFAQPAVRKPPIDRLTDPQRPELAAAAQAFLSQFESEEELRVVVAAFNPRILGTQLPNSKR